MVRPCLSVAIHMHGYNAACTHWLGVVQQSRQTLEHAMSNGMPPYEALASPTLATHTFAPEAHSSKRLFARSECSCAQSCVDSEEQAEWTSAELRLQLHLPGQKRVLCMTKPSIGPSLSKLQSSGPNKQWQRCCMLPHAHASCSTMIYTVSTCAHANDGCMLERVATKQRIADGR
jgi:hypothetical protein